MGHALEHIGKGTLSHGFCVAFGMVVESIFFEGEGKCSKEITGYILQGVRDIWGSMHIPDEIEDSAIASRLQFDNKRKGNKIPFAYLECLQKPKSIFKELTESFTDRIIDCIQNARKILL